MLKRTYLRLVEMQEEQARQHLEEVRSIHNEMRGYKHDFHHHLQALKGQLEAGQVERAIAYLEQLDRSLQTVDTLLKTGNVTVDAILSAKLAQARAAGIAVTAEANLPPERGWRKIPPPFSADEGRYALFLSSQQRREEAEEGWLPLPDGEDRCTRLRPAPGRGHCEAAWRLGEIQQRGRRVHVGIPRPRRVLNAIRAPLEAVGARSLFFGALCATVEAEGGDMP